MYLTLGILGFTVLCVAIDGLMGLIRGRNRAFLRLILVALSAAVSVVLIGVLVPMVMELEIDGAPVKQVILDAFSSGETALPEQIQVLLMTLIEIILGVVIFFVSFFALKFLTWLIVFPILKIFIRKGRRKRAISGLVFGAVEGLLVAFVVCAPLTGLLTDVNKFTSIKMNGEQLIQLPAEIGLDEYFNSPVFKIYDASGKWFYDMLTSKQTEEGKNLSISDTVDVVVAVTEVASKAQELGDSVDKLTSEDTNEKTAALDQIGQTLIEIDDSINKLGDGGKEILTDLIGSVIEMAGGSSEGEGEGESALPPEVKGFVEELANGNVSLKATGSALQGMASYISKTDETSDKFGEEVTDDEVNAIVNGLAENAFVLDMIAGEGEETPVIMQVHDENKEKFETAIHNASLGDDYKDTLRKLFGLNAAQD